MREWVFEVGRDVDLLSSWDLRKGCGSSEFWVYEVGRDVDFLSSEWVFGKGCGSSEFGVGI